MCSSPARHPVLPAGALARVRALGICASRRATRRVAGHLPAAATARKGGVSWLAIRSRAVALPGAGGGRGGRRIPLVLFLPAAAAHRPPVARRCRLDRRPLHAGERGHLRGAPPPGALGPAGRGLHDGAAGAARVPGAGDRRAAGTARRTRHALEQRCCTGLHKRQEHRAAAGRAGDQLLPARAASRRWTGCSSICSRACSPSSCSRWGWWRRAASFELCATFGPFLIGFAILMPLFGAALGVAAGTTLGLSVGGDAVVATLYASALHRRAGGVRLTVPP